MPVRHLVVIAPKDAPYLSALDRLPSSLQITVGDKPEDLHSVIGDAEVIATGLGKKHTFHEILPLAKNVKWIHAFSAGVEHLLVPELVQSPVPFTNSRGVYKESLGEFAIAAMLFFAKDLRKMVQNQQAGIWEQFTVEELFRQTLGIVGYGEIGKSAARRAKAMGMRVLATTRRPELSVGDTTVDRFFPLSERAAMMAECDYVLAAAALTPETRGLVGDKEIRSMKSTGVVMNLGRGPVIEEKALVNALTEKRIRGAALDVFDVEPLPADHPYWKLNVLVSPHTADHTGTWLHETMEFFVRNFERYEKGEPLENVIDKHAGY